MDLERSTGLSLRLVALSGVLSLVLTLEAPPWITVPALAFIAGGIISPRKLGRLHLPSHIQAPAAAGALVFAVIDFFFIGGSLIVAAADFLTVLVCLKLLSPGTYRDYVQLVGAGFFLLLSSTGLSTEIYFLAPFLMFFVSCAWAMMLLTIRAEAEQRNAGRSGWKFGSGFFLGTAGLTVGALVVTLCIFLAIPRVGIGFFSRHVGGLIRTSGFSDTVELGSVGEVKLDPEKVMRVRFEVLADKPDFPLYWRGRAFDHYDGTSWKDTGKDFARLGRSAMGTYYTQLYPSAGGNLVEQSISLEPLDTPVIFALYPPLYVTTDIRGLYRNSADAIMSSYPPGKRLHYTARSPVPAPLGVAPDWMRGAYGQDLPEKEEELYLQLPEGSDRLRDLGLRVAGDAGTNMSRADLIQVYVERNHTYTLDPPRNRALSPIDDFLFDSRAGFCEHFATAMVLMLRAAGVPARLVAGYAGGEWNEMGNYFIVRERDAHTWVEVFSPGYGWVAYDPTPPAPVEQGSLLAAKLDGFLDFVKYRWDRYIVYYNMRDQMSALGKASDAYYDLSGDIRSIAKDLGQALRPSGLASRLSGNIAAIISLILLFAALAATAYLVQRYRRYGSLAPGVVGFYAELERALKKRGMVRATGETPQEFAARAADALGGPFMGAVYVARAFYMVRYGGHRLGPGELKRVRDAVDGIRNYGS